MADAGDLKSSVPQGMSRFDPGLRHIEADLRRFFKEDTGVERPWVVLSHDCVGASGSASRSLAPDPLEAPASAER